MIKFAVCDDEPSVLCDFKARLSAYMEERRLDYKIICFRSGKAVLDSDMQFDMLFLDIQMERPDGMETAALLRQRGFQGQLVFITVLKESVYDSFEVQAFDYLLKPVDNLRFRRTMDRFMKITQQAAVKCIIVRKGGDSQVIPCAGVVYCEVIARKIYIHCRGGETVDYYDRLENLEKQLDSRFFKCHRSYLVNLDYVRGCHGGLVSLTGGGEIPVSRLREEEFTKALLIHMKERRQDGQFSSFV